jgi:hypothetical protein
MRHHHRTDPCKVIILISLILRNDCANHFRQSSKCRVSISYVCPVTQIIQDISLAQALLSLSPSAQREKSIFASQGADILLGGHDHLYYVSKGVTSWQNYDLTQDVLGAEHDHGDILVVKSGTDFRDLSEFTLDLEDTPPGSVRRKVIKSINGKLSAVYYT